MNLIKTLIRYTFYTLLTLVFCAWALVTYNVKIEQKVKIQSHLKNLWLVETEVYVYNNGKIETLELWLTDYVNSNDTIKYKKIQMKKAKYFKVKIERALGN